MSVQSRDWEIVCGDDVKWREKEGGSGSETSQYWVDQCVTESLGEREGVDHTKRYLDSNIMAAYPMPIPRPISEDPPPPRQHSYPQQYS